MSDRTPTMTIALAGQPNVGKSTIYNLLTGQSQYVSNWPGKTCECQMGFILFEDEHICLVDLPGSYSLAAGSMEEQSARELILEGRPDVIAVILDAACLERNLYLVAELLSLPVPLVLGLNRMDLAAAQGIHIEPHVLQAAIGAPVVPLTASRGQGAQELVAAAVRAARQAQDWNPNRPAIRADHLQVLQQIEALIGDDVPQGYPPGWVALKLLEGDAPLTRTVSEGMGERWGPVYHLLRQHDDAFLAVAGGRYDWIGRMLRAAVAQPKAGALGITDRLDRAATHPLWGLLILLVVMGSLFGLTFWLGVPLQAWLETHVVQTAAAWVQAALNGGPGWLSSLVAKGLIGGVGTVLTLLPVLVIFFAGLGALEDAGYMARAAFVMDRWMHPMGLHGKSFLPLSLGFGCNVPAVMGSRMIETPKARLITILIAPLAPCSARLSVLAFLAPIFFGAYAGWAALALIGLPLLALAGLGKLLHELFLGREHTAFIMELPLYQAPDPASIARGLWQRTADFLKGAGSVILVMSVLLWALSTFPGGEISSSYLAWIGRGLAPLGRLMGLEWPMMVALMTSVLRKENTIPTLAVLYGAAQTSGGLGVALAGQITPAAGLAFLAVQMLFVPCVATMAAMRSETKSWKWTLLSTGLLLALSLAAGILIYQAERLLGFGG